MPGPIDARTLQRFTESPNRSKHLFLRSSGRKIVTHFSWNCSSSPSAASRRAGRAPPAPDRPWKQAAN
ncbi:MAG: hypothetical protein E5V92_19990 [Mesorhizobium sp.]|nr:hypothetical protein EJ067_26615 [Mesorhizobium sp. M1D.F.Ca.ET.043.01.1.1]RWA96803.1 MAG: hypothetical protein EOQ32_04215 [Mesorhizobium sp.]RWE04422.1 MAG: hypothetical protein EOS61_25905 [Mesorhizobium sp.]TJW83068.1 MAG: hypothetical protein E5V92_19990 [Mesorhizobium sp.]